MNQLSAPMNSSHHRTQPMRRYHTIEIEHGVYCLPEDTVGLEVVTGSAWLTMNGKDIILHSGDGLPIKPDSHPAVVSSVNNQRLLFVIRR